MAEIKHMFNIEKATFQLCKTPTMTNKDAMPANNKILRCVGAICAVDFGPVAGLFGCCVIMSSR
jgi:hypothetical protein